VHSFEYYNNTFTKSGGTGQRGLYFRGGTGVVFNNTWNSDGAEWQSYGCILVTNYCSCPDQLNCGWAPCTEYPCIDQIGRSTDSDGDGTQDLEPLYEWNNVNNNENQNICVYDPCPTMNEHIKEGRDFYNDTPRPGYVPFTYPHPLVTDSPITGSINDDRNSRQVNNYLLSQNYPNPFNPATTIKYSIPVYSRQYAVGSQNNQSFNQPITKSNSDLLIIQLKVYNILGKEVATLVNESQRPGDYEVKWDARHLSSGVYFYQLKAGNFIRVKKLILMK
jgi:hypothetical protein